jgi:hypothetical protein
MEAIQKAKDSFNHDLEAIHDDEMASGADAALVKHLTFLAFHAQHQQNDQETLELILTEISLTCDALESLFRASSQVLGGSFARMGRELLQLLVGVIDNEISRRQRMADNKMKQQQDGNKDADDEKGEQDKQEGAEDHDSGCTPDLDTDAGRNSDDSFAITSPTSDVAQPLGTAEGDLLLRKATKLLGHFARVGEATKPMAHFPGLLGILLCLTNLQPYSAVPWEARLSALWTLANLACNSDNMQMMACTPGLIGSLVEVASRPLHPGDSLEKTIEIMRSRAIASRAILNLSWSPENKVILSEHEPLVDLLAELCVHRNAPLHQSHTALGILLTTRRHAVGALRNLAAAPRRIKINLCEYKNGHVLDVLTDAALNDPDTGVKDRAFAAIHNLAIHDTANNIVSHPALVLALKDVLLSEEDSAEHEGGESPKAHASATLLVLERSITPLMDSYENLRELLDAVNPNPTANDDDELVEDELETLHATAV